MIEIKFTLNGKLVKRRVEPLRPALDTLREGGGMTGTKEGCREGECGACTVLFNGEPIQSCLLPSMELAGGRVETVESLGTPEELNALQAALLETGGAQCGFCTPGVLMRAADLLARPRTGKKTLGETEVREAMAGNLCRCTGYGAIVKAILSRVKKSRIQKSRRGGLKR